MYLTVSTTKPRKCPSRGDKNEKSHCKPNLANHIRGFIRTTFRLAVLGSVKYFVYANTCASSLQSTLLQIQHHFSQMKWECLLASPYQVHMCYSVATSGGELHHVYGVFFFYFPGVAGSSYVTPIHIHIHPQFWCLAWDLMAHSCECCGEVMGVWVKMCGDVGAGKSILCRSLVNMWNRFAILLLRVLYTFLYSLMEDDCNWYSISVWPHACEKKQGRWTVLLSYSS